jgi:tight adherence protein B
MDAAHLRYVLVVGSSMALIGLGVSAVMVTQAHKQAERRKERLASVVAAHLRPMETAASAYGDASRSTESSWLKTVGWIFGFDPDKTALYPTRWWIVLIGLLVAARVAESVIADFLGSWAPYAVPAIWLVMCRNFFAYFERKRQIQLLTEFPEALALLVRAIRVGIPVMEAIRSVSRSAPPITAAGFARLVEQVAIGVTLDEAVQALARSTGLTEYRFFATTLTLQNQTGGNLSDTLETLADMIRKRAALKAKGRAMTSEARSSSMVLAVLPLLTGLLLWIVSPRYISVLFTDPTGRWMLGLAVVMLTMGILSILTIIKKTLS